uniref:Uncharacterized protein n=1 Tax=Arundo donax TaxID=35708 RepID=A0A0A9E420_ARUDO
MYELVLERCCNLLSSCICFLILVSCDPRFSLPHSTKLDPAACFQVIVHDIFDLIPLTCCILDALASFGIVLDLRNL